MKFFIPSLTGMVGFWATVALNIPDFTRYAKSQKAQMPGTGAGIARRHDALFLHRRSGHLGVGGAVRRKPSGTRSCCWADSISRWWRSIALVALLVATLNTNVAANVVSPSNDFSNLNPRLISFRTGGLITGVMGVLMMPWKLLTDFSSYIFGWLVGYSGLLGPIAGVMIADYFLMRRARLSVDDLYRRGGEYEYATASIRAPWWRWRRGSRWRCSAWSCPRVRWLYDYAWFVGFGVSGAVYVVLMQRAEAPVWEGES